jgi:hypothetical protein
VLISGSITCLLVDSLIIRHCLVLIVWFWLCKPYLSFVVSFNMIEPPTPKSEGQSSCTCVLLSSWSRMEGHRTPAVLTHREYLIAVSLRLKTCVSNDSKVIYLLGTYESFKLPSSSAGSSEEYSLFQLLIVCCQAFRNLVVIALVDLIDCCFRLFLTL